MTSAVQKSVNTERRPPWVEPEDAIRHASPRGEVAIWFPAPRVIVYKYKGYTDASHARFIEKTFDEAFGPDERHIHVFSDTELQTGGDPEFRRLTGLRAKRIRHRTDTYCLLVKSRVVRLGIYLTAFVMNAPSANGFSANVSAIADRGLGREWSLGRSTQRAQSARAEADPHVRRDDIRGGADHRHGPRQRSSWYAS